LKDEVRKSPVLAQITSGLPLVRILTVWMSLSFLFPRHITREKANAIPVRASFVGLELEVDEELIGFVETKHKWTLTRLGLDSTVTGDQECREF
jgi:hypothetical protein